ncbi:MAG TPA: Smr/MutS family protein [Polyangiaceae bacterium]|nr:Smr/MutS family protein [Polyangiaceae bacterium]
MILSQDDDQFYASAPGTSLKSLQELQRGRHSPQITLDAHGMTVAKASAALDAVLQQALDTGLRTLLVIHGRGHNSGSAGPVLRNAVLDHLTRLRAGVVLMLCNAPPKWGGAGATLVRLRQSRR